MRGWRLLGACCLLLNSALARPALAEEPRWLSGPRVTSPVRGELVARDEDPDREDGVYGRFDGDLTLALGLGAELDGDARGAVIGRALYYHSLGLVVGYGDSFGSSAPIERSGFMAAELRPLFLPRWALDKESGVALLDLTLDSVSLSVGGFVAEQRGKSERTRVGPEFGLGLGVPLFARARGPWLEARAYARPGLGERAMGALLALSWYEAVVTALVE